MEDEEGKQNKQKVLVRCKYNHNSRFRKGRDYIYMKNMCIAHVYMYMYIFTFL